MQKQTGDGKRPSMHKINRGTVSCGPLIRVLLRIIDRHSSEHTEGGFSIVDSHIHAYARQTRCTVELQGGQVQSQDGTRNCEKSGWKKGQLEVQ